MPSLNEERGEQKFTPKKSLRRTLVERHVLDWLRKERKYADEKYPVSTVEELGKGQLRQEDIDFVNQYLHRASYFGLDTFQGRQALGKAFSTLYHFCQAAVYMHGVMPAPGDTTDGIKPWEDGPPL